MVVEWHRIQALAPSFVPSFVPSKRWARHVGDSNVVLPLLAEHRAHETDGQMVTIAWQKELHRLFTRESTEQLPPAIAAGASTLKLVHDKMTPQLYQLGVRLRDLRFRTGPTMARVARISDFA